MPHTPPNSEIICGQNVGTKVVCGIIFFFEKKSMLKIWRKSWVPSRSYLLNSTANYKENHPTNHFCAHILATYYFWVRWCAQRLRLQKLVHALYVYVRMSEHGISTKYSSFVSGFVHFFLDPFGNVRLGNGYQQYPNLWKRMYNVQHNWNNHRLWVIDIVI